MSRDGRDGRDGLTGSTGSAGRDGRTDFFKWLIRDSIALFILLWIMGAFQLVLPSPLVDKLNAAEKTFREALAKHETATTQAVRGTCRGVWRDQPQWVQDQQCGK